MANTKINLLSSDEEQLKWAAEQGIEPHPFKGSIDDDCEVCESSIYMAVHRESCPRESWMDI